MNQIISALLLWLFFSNSYVQQLSEMFYVTMETKDALGLQKEHPNDIRIICSRV